MSMTFTQKLKTITLMFVVVSAHAKPGKPVGTNPVRPGGSATGKVDAEGNIRADTHLQGEAGSVPRTQIRGTLSGDGSTVPRGAGGGRFSMEAPADTLAPNVAAAAGKQFVSLLVADADPNAKGVQFKYTGYDGKDVKLDVSPEAAFAVAALMGDGLGAKIAQELGKSPIPSDEEAGVGIGRIAAKMAEILDLTPKDASGGWSDATKLAAYEQAVVNFVHGGQSLETAAAKLAKQMDISVDEAKKILAEKKASICKCSGQCKA